MKRFSPSVFAMAFCSAYVCVFAVDWPLFRYYPLHGDISMGRQLLRGLGPAITWYGLMANAAIVAGVLASVIPERATDRIRGYVWLLPCGAMLGSAFLLRHFFI